MICLTRTQIKYLTAIYQVSLKGDVRVTKVADYLNCSKPSVTRALKNLKKLDLIEPDQKIILTQMGQAYAQNIIETDLTFFQFLTEILKVEKETAKTDVINFKSYVSCQTIDKLESYICDILKKPKSHKAKMICQYHKCNNCK